MGSILVSADHNGFEDDWRPYAYLSCQRKIGVDRLRSREHLMQEALGERRFALYTEWLARIEGEPYEYILVRTEELDWMGEAGELEKTLRKAMRHLEQVCSDGTMKMSDAMRDIAGLWSEEVLNECESFELVGVANSAPAWPASFEPKPVKTASLRSPNRPWWAFWR